MLQDEASYLLEPTRLSAFNQYPDNLAPGCRVTLQLLLCLPNDGVVLVNPANDESNSWWIPPQGGREKSDSSPIATALRKMNEELGVMPKLVEISRVQVLGTYLNELPSERKTPNKFMLVVAVPIKRAWFTLGEENSHYLVARHIRQVMEAMQTVKMNRPLKYTKTVGACVLAVSQEFLSGDFIS